VEASELMRNQLTTNKSGRVNLRYSVKRLTPSDLTFFDVQFRRVNSGNQKAINLNRNVFVDVLYPTAAVLAGGQPLHFPCELRIFGPDAQQKPNVVMRKIIAAGGSQKNWRLNGETVHSPSDEAADRYANLQRDDLAVFGFNEGGVPSEAVIVLLSQGSVQDATIFRLLNGLVGPGNMAALSDRQLLAAVEASDAGHPIRELLDPELDEALTDAALGSSTAVETLRSRGIRRTSHKALADARATAERVGRDGEALVNAYLKGLLARGDLAAFTWEAEINATHPFDFTVDRNSGIPCSVEVKSTEGEHERNLIFSHAEIEHAATAANLEIWRISKMEGGKANVRISNSLSGVSKRLLGARSLIAGVVPTGWTIPTDTLAPWGDPFVIASEDDPDE
jgi:hypothetical protein